MKYFAHKDFGVFNIQVRHSKWVDDGNGGGQRVYDNSPTTETVRLLIDIDSIVRQIGARAVTSKSGKSKFMSGAVIVHHIKKQEVA